MLESFLTQPLNSKHNRDNFFCNEPSLNTYLQRYARLDQKRKETAVFVFIGEDNQIIGYYTLSALSVSIDSFPEDVIKKLRLSTYKYKPTTLLGRLAVDKRFENQQLGKHLLIDSLKRSYEQSKQVGSMAMIVEALHNDATGFYLKFGFIPFPNQPLRLFLPMKTIGKLF